MPDTVLVALDGAPQSESALLYALDAFPDASITALHVVDVRGDPDADVGRVRDDTDVGIGHGRDDPDEGVDPSSAGRAELEARGESILETAASIAADRDRPIDTVLRSGVPRREVIARVADAEVDHAVLGGHGRSPVEGTFLGEVSEAAVRRSAVATTLVPLHPDVYRAGELEGSVLVPVDGSPAAVAALEFAVSAFPGAETTALHVVGLPFEYSRREIEESPLDRLLAGLTERGEAVLESTLDAADLGDATVETAITYGKPAQSIVDYALDYAFDQVVMGFHGRPRFSQLLTGNVAETVARRASFPVTFVRPGPAVEGADRSNSDG